FMKPDISSALNSPGILVVGFLYGLIPTSLAYLVYYNALKMIDDTSKVPVIASIEPVAAVMIGMTFYGEKIGIVNLIGIAVVLISIIIMAKSKSK
ncbi:MAG: EamA family transporter, partial [Synergistaceae bacterium]|nr:EamA family transporter [Synergistaceae bacterium]